VQFRIRLALADEWLRYLVQHWYTVIVLSLLRPLTGAGRMVAFALLIGIALLVTVTATLASWLVETVEAENQQCQRLPS
jgi:hypothetical protein